jgi:hypothetical protein
MTNDKKTRVTPALLGAAVVLMLASLLFLSFGLSGCKATIGYTGTNTDNQLIGSYELFNGTRSTTIIVESGKTLLISYNSVVESGELTIKLYDSDHNLVFEFPTGTTEINTFTAHRQETFLLEVNGNDTKGSFSLQWLTD